MVEPGSWVLFSPEQTNKTGAIGAIVGLASLCQRPTVVIVKDMAQSTLEVAGKLRKLLQGFDSFRCAYPDQPPTGPNGIHFKAGGKRDWKEWRLDLAEQAMRAARGNKNKMTAAAAWREKAIANINAFQR